MQITIIAGARPNFMKIAPIIEATKKEVAKGTSLHYRLVHTGQHYHKKMSQDFFEQPDMPEPDVNLEAESGSQAEQIANTMIRFEKELLNHPADVVLVMGDVTSTSSCSIVVKKLNTNVADVKAGMRSGDLSMPEEINRMVTDAIIDCFFTTPELANNHLRNSGIKDDTIFFVGNTMIDTLLKQMSNFKKHEVCDNVNLKGKEYFVFTLHRPANVDHEEDLKILMDEIVKLCQNLTIVFPFHPQTSRMLKKTGIEAQTLHRIEPLSYFKFNYLVKFTKSVITDSGGITGETTVMRSPCMTLRNNADRPETCTLGTTELLATDPKASQPAMDKLFKGEWNKGNIPDLLDGNAAVQIVEHLVKEYEQLH